MNTPVYYIVPHSEVCSFEAAFFIFRISLNKFCEIERGSNYTELNTD